MDALVSVFCPVVGNIINNDGLVRFQELKMDYFLAAPPTSHTTSASSTASLVLASCLSRLRFSVNRIHSTNLCMKTFPFLMRNEIQACFSLTMQGLLKHFVLMKNLTDLKVYYSEHLPPKYHSEGCPIPVVSGHPLTS